MKDDAPAPWSESCSWPLAAIELVRAVRVAVQGCFRPEAAVAASAPIVTNASQPSGVALARNRADFTEQLPHELVSCGSERLDSVHAINGAAIMTYPKDLEGPQPFNVAALLGEILIGSSSVELAVQLYLDGIARAEGRAPAEATAEERLGQLLTFADGLVHKTLRDDFMRWMVRLHELAPTCRAVRYGHWLPDLRRGNVLMLAPPGTQDLGSRTWEVAQLGEAAQALILLYRELLRLCAVERGLTLTNAAKFLSTQPLQVMEEAA